MSERPAEVTEAIDSVARQIIWNAVDGDPIEFAWENYPDIGQGDWYDVIDRVRQLAGSVAPNPNLYRPAYDILAARADVQS